jgi:hypothetical protein
MPPSAVRNAMELQAEAERRKRAQVGAGQPSLCLLACGCSGCRVLDALFCG